MTPPATPDLAPPDLATNDLATGLSWHLEQSGTSADLTSVWGSGADDVWIAGGQSTVLHSTTRGQQWDVMVLAAPQYTEGVGAVGSKDIYVANPANTIFHSADSGMTWSEDHPDPNSMDCCDGVAILGNDVYTTGGKKLYHSTPATPGVWTITLEPGGTIGAVMTLANGRVYVGAEQGGAWYTVDMGQSWVDVSEPLSEIISSLWSPGGIEIYAGGEHGFIVHSSDGGLNWQIQRPVDLNSVWSIAAIWGSSTYDIYAIGPYPMILHSSDGATWQAEPDPAAPNQGSHTVWGSAANDVYLVGTQGSIMHLY